MEYLALFVSALALSFIVAYGVVDTWLRAKKDNERHEQHSGEMAQLQTELEILKKQFAAVDQYLFQKFGDEYTQYMIRYFPPPPAPFGQYQARYPYQNGDHSQFQPRQTTNS